ncbi:ATP-binding protein [Herpetosiphon giganteus]|uniref:ATP-binding protein n=1 Tax=Herpetosiphon giganteus TaxID=2029754 RepID=UPI001958029D|nr:ATP-binding protein [Herpetosiphon giganteus]MBM7842844.1 PAS domain S-box-containing protein [Herpetosiphon giganteus]
MLSHEQLETENASLKREVELLRHQLATQPAEPLFQSLLEAAPDGVVIVNAHGVIVVVNAQAEAIFGYERESMIGQPIEILIPERVRGVHVAYRSNYTQEPRTRPMGIGSDLLARRSDGSEFYTEISLSPLKTTEQLLIIAVVRDVTEQKKLAKEHEHRLTQRVSAAEAALLQGARLAAVGQLSASIAHEINNPLYAARNALLLLEEDLPDDLRESPIMQLARDQLTRIAGIIERMRDFYRPMRGEMAPTDINEIIEETLALAGLHARHNNTVITFTPDPQLPAVVCNADQLRQVFLNLVLNALEAMTTGGTLTVTTEAATSFATIEICDTGTGIPDDIRAHLFEPFFTNKPNGTGLGLPISAHIVTQHGGQIEVDSTVGVGSTFRVVLPYQPS